MDDGFADRLGRFAREMLTLAPAPEEVTDFGSNPGRLRMLVEAPVMARQGAPLLVLLHGCGQDPVRFAAASGFAALAGRLGAPLLLPVQQGENNQGTCFNWFLPAAMRRGAGEVESVRQMVATAARRFATDPARVFVAGLSAGGAFAAALLVAYPEVFAGGAVVAGLPVGAADSLSAALNRMNHAAPASRAEWCARAGLRPGARLPKLSVWHGEADRVIDPANGDALVGQWTGLLGLDAAPDAEIIPAPGVRRRMWGEAVEQWSIAGYGHGFPVAGTTYADPFVLPAGIDATAAIAGFWRLDRG